MKPQDKKLAVLQFLKEEVLPISLPELLAKLGRDFKERTVRRWLNEMQLEGLIEKTGQRRGTKYQVKDKQPQDRVVVSGCFGSESLGVIERVRKPLFEREPISYNDRWFESYEPNVTFYLTEEDRLKLHSAGSRANNNDPAGTYAHQIYNRLLIDLSYNSSRLEGNTYSLLDTERLVLSGESAEGKLDEEKVMILNHKETIRYLVEGASRLKVGFETICTVHYLLADSLVEPKYTGKVRDHGVRISGSTYMPYEDPRRLKLQLERISDKAAKINDPFEQSLFLLIHLSYLQAFSDVNKRTARLCANIPLITGNLVPLSFNDVKREDYTSAIIAVYELQEVRPIVDLYLFSYLRTCLAYDSSVKTLGFDEVRVRFRQQRRAVLRGVIENGMIGQPMLAFIESEAKIRVPEEVREDFIGDVIEDLEFMDQSRIVGLGITLEQLNVWLKIRGNQ